MVIGFDASRAFISGRTGTENYSFQLLKALAKIDKKNQYIVYVRLDYSSNAVRSYHNTWPKNFQFKEIPWPRLWTQGGLALQTFKDPLDVLFVPSHTLPLIRKPGLKTVVTVHDLGSEYLPLTHQIKQRLYLGFMQKFQLKTATKIIAVSKATKEDLVNKLGIEPEKIKVVYEGYDKERFKVQGSHPKDGRSVDEKFKVNQTIKKYNLQYQKYFLFVGTVQPRKNLARLIRAFGIYSSSEERSDESRSSRLANARSNNNPIQLVIAGSKGWLSDEIYNAAAIVNQRYKKRSDVIASDYKLPRKLGVEERVKFLGYVPDRDLPALYSGAIALTFPSLFEGFGLPILEAQACGCPVLTSNTSSMPEVAGKGAVLVDPYSEDDIVEGMVGIMNNESRIKLVKAGFENIKRFSWEKCARETLEVLEKL